MASTGEGTTSSWTDLLPGLALFAAPVQEPEAPLSWEASPGLEDLGTRLAPEAEAILEEACHWLGIPESPRGTLHWVSDRQEIIQALDSKLPEWSAAVTFPGTGDVWLATKIAGGMDRLRVTLRHELVHLAMGSLGRETFERLPAWFHEGCAEHFAGDLYLGKVGVSLPWRAFTGSLSSLAEFREDFGHEADHAAEGYSLGHAMVERLLRLHGQDLAAKILRRAAEGDSLDQALVALTGLSVVTHEKDLRAELASAHALAGEIAPEFLTLIFLTLALAFPWFLHLRKKKRMRFELQWEESEALEAAAGPEKKGEDFRDALDAWIQREEDSGR